MVAVVAGGLVVLALAAGMWLLPADDDADSRDGSVAVDDADAEVPPVRPPDRYRIDYRVEVGPAGEALVSSDRLLVDRPFSSRLETYAGPEPAGAPVSIEVATFGRLRARSETAPDDVVLAVPPAPGRSDTRILDALPAALADGAVEAREVRTVLGRRCRVHRSALPLAVADLVAAPSEQDHTDTCIDGAGLVLEEVSVADGARVSRRIAIDVELAPDLDEQLFTVGEPTLDTDEGGGFLAELVPGSRAPGEFHEPAGPPSGFELRGRYAVVPPQAENFGDDTRRDQRRTFVSDVFVDGADVVVLDQGSTLGNVEPFQGLRGTTVEIEGFDEGTLTYGRGGPVVLVRLGHGRFLRARGTVEPEMLVELLESLEQVEGGELELLDPSRERPQRGGG